MKTIYRWFPLLILVFLLTACTSPTEVLPTNTPVPVDPTPEVESEDTSQDAEKDEDQESVGETIDPLALWEANNCSRCHGENREGDFAPALLPEVMKKDASEYVQTITNGSGSMPAFGGKMSPDEIEALVEWLMTVTP